MYNYNKFHHNSGDYMEKYRVCPLFLVLLDVYIEVIGMSVTHLGIYLFNSLHKITVVQKC
jgi:hypothetical protein